MFISDLDYLKIISDSETNSVITGGLSYFEYFERRSFKPVFLFDKTSSEDGTTVVSQGGYLENDKGEVSGVFSSSSVSYTYPTTAY